MLELYTVSDKYIRYLRETVPNVYDPHEGHRSHDRKYLGVLLRINGFTYFAPLSSPKRTDYFAGGDQIRRSTLTIMRMTKTSLEVECLLGTIRLSHMIPVPDTEIRKYDVYTEPDEAYQRLVCDELRWIEHNDTAIIKSAKQVYEIKTHENDRRNEKNAKMLDSILPFFTLQQLCADWCSND